MFFTLPSYANTLDLYFAGGANFPHLRNTTGVPVSNTQVNDYLTKKQDHAQFLGGVGVGHTFENIGMTPINFSIGAIGYYNDFGFVKGTVYPFANMNSTNTSSYRFDVASYALLGELRISYSDLVLQPYILGGAGTAWNRLSNYKQSPNNGHTFTNHTNNDFAFEAGAGFQYLLPFTYGSGDYSTYYSLDIGYRYLDLGKGESGQVAGQLSGDRLTISHMRTQAVLVELKLAM